MLNIEIGRYSNIPRKNRLCSYKRDVETVWHILAECPLLTSSILNVSHGVKGLSDLFSEEKNTRVLDFISENTENSNWYYIRYFSLSTAYLSICLMNNDSLYELN